MFIALKLLRNIGAVNVVLAVAFLGGAGRDLGLVLLLSVAVAALAGASVAAWWRFTFRVDGDELIVTRGVVSVQRLTIPLTRVQSVTIDQKLLHRLVGLVQVSVDTAGSSGVEFEIQAVRRDVAEALRSRADATRSTVPGVDDRTGDRGRRTAAAVPEPDGRGVDGPRRSATTSTPTEIVAHRSPAELLRAGLARPDLRSLFVVAPVILLADDVLPDEVVSRTVDVVSGGGVAVDVAVAVGLGLVGIVVFVLAGVVRDWDLTVEREGTVLRRSSGLLDVTATSLSAGRVQRLRVRQNPIERRWGISRVELDSVGDEARGVPGADDGEVGRWRSIVLDSDRPVALDRSVSRSIVLYRVRNRVLLLLPLAVVAVGGPRPWTAWLTVVGVMGLAIPVVGLREWWRWRNLRWSVTATRLGERHGIVDTVTTEFLLTKIQTVEITSTRFERRRGLATLRVVTAGGRTTIPFVDERLARTTRDSLVSVVESSPRSFM